MYMMDNSEFVMIETVTAVGCYCLEKAAPRGGISITDVTIV